MKSTAQKIRKMTDAGYKPKEIYKKLGGRATINTIYTVRTNYKKKKIPNLVLASPAPATKAAQNRDYAFDLAVPDRPSLWMRVKRWLLGDSK
jgi:hypothetical protein